MNADEEADKPASRKQLKGSLSKLSRDELIKLVGDLYSTSPDNRRFLDARFSSSVSVATSKSLTPFKAIIGKSLDPDVMTGRAPLSFVPVRKAISDYKKATGDLQGVLELMVYAVECGNNFTLEYGDINEQFYTNLESLFRKTAQLLKTMDKGTIDAFLPRLLDVVEKSDGIGWGYHDGISDAIYEAFPSE